MPRLIALDLGSHAVKATLYNISGRSQIDLQGRHSQAVPQDGASPTLEQRLVALDALLDNNPALKPQPADTVVVAWPSNEAAFHRVPMPFTDTAQIERTLPGVIESEVPFELDEMVLAWRIAEQQDQTQVLTALARKARVGEWLAALNQRNIDPAGLHIDADLFGPWGGGVAEIEDGPTEILNRESADQPADPLIAVVDVGHLHTTISVIRNAIVQYARSINVAGWAFTRAIAEGAAISWQEAEQLKHQGADALGAEPREKLAASMALLVAEVRAALIKAEDTLGAEVLEVRVTGGSAQLVELVELLEGDLGVPVRLALDPRAAETPTEFSVAQALAFTTVGGAATPIDLRVGEFRYKGRIDWVRQILVYGLAGAAIFAVASLVMFAFQYWTLAKEQAATEAAVLEIVQTAFPEVPGSMLESMGKAEAAMAQLTQDAVQRSQVLGNGTGGVPPTVDALYHLTAAFPPHPEVTVEVSELTISPQSITLNAETDGFQSSAKVEEKLKENPRFHTAVKGQEQKLGNGRVRFPITIPLGTEGETEGQKTGEEG